MLQFQIQLMDDTNGTSISATITGRKKVKLNIERFDKIIFDRMRARGIVIDVFFIRIILAESYMDMQDMDVRDSESHLFDKPQVNEIFEP